MQAAPGRTPKDRSGGCPGRRPRLDGRPATGEAIAGTQAEPGPVPNEGDSNGGGPGAQELHKGALVIAQSGRNGADDYRRERPRLQVETAMTTGEDSNDFRWRRRGLQGDDDHDFRWRRRRMQEKAATNAGEGSDDYRRRKQRL